ncbi:hypothetical protein [Natronolimnohabitans innermongolicus]|uniref:Nudix hydrolase domain-containing protein n=1 Tax=Natronolimnohabitans innermongolicus JCM 12255 TaxID=1227499 RepID=L9XAK8_9EURY|nr:hypothetical protein [Natronolimnohabitans innermongolicus]ELY58755.1 hypothetical protein C493_06292 [Natronolimnohabitans innermongolicus JCM 12255]
MDAPLDPESLRERDAVAVDTETRTVTQAEFETARDLESRLTLGVVTEAGELLFVAAGARGWTLPAVPVDPDAEWTGVARRALESLTGRRLQVAEPIRLRRVEFRQEDSPNRSHTTYDVLARTKPVPGRPVADEPTIDGEDVEDLVWLTDAPEDASDGLAADVRAVLE